MVSVAGLSACSSSCWSSSRDGAHDALFQDRLNTRSSSLVHSKLLRPLSWASFSVPYLTGVFKLGANLGSQTAVLIALRLTEPTTLASSGCQPPTRSNCRRRWISRIAARTRSYTVSGSAVASTRTNRSGSASIIARSCREAAWTRLSPCSSRRFAVRRFRDRGRDTRSGPAGGSRGMDFSDVDSGSSNVPGPASVSP